MIRPFLEDGIFLSQIARERSIPLRTLQRWVRRYRKGGIAGLVRKGREDKDRLRRSPSLREVIEGLALQKPRPSAATVHRKAVEIAKELGERPPSYSMVYALIRSVLPAGVQKVIPPVPGREVARQALKDPRCRSVNAERERKELGFVDRR